MSVNVDIPADTSYPILRSGTVTFSRITDPSIAVAIDCSQDDSSKPYGADAILMDSGASVTLFPTELAEALVLAEPDPDTDRWVITTGVGGVNIGYVPEEPVMLEIVGKHGASARGHIFPVIYLGCAPVFSAVQEHIETLQTYTFKKPIAQSVLVPYSLNEDRLSAAVTAPDGVCPLLNKRPLLSDPAANRGLQMIIIGRDWQRQFKLVFQQRTLRID